MIESEEGPGTRRSDACSGSRGEFASVEDAAAKLVHIKETIDPDPELVAKYEARYQQFRQIYPACKPIFEIL